ncbi:unnamed protein product [Schistosoma margrebowiei]|uniref:Uncharacterized protein n=1 Tax=Schistosoma margrebowiei TaxID=48269 RepID=A0A183LCL2_9TREM|nr:unnamed protein product [Schistosoma margrebowiei]
MRRYNLTVLRISETHWTEAEQQRLGVGEMPLYSDHKEKSAPHTQRFALMLSKEAQNERIEWEYHEYR